MLTLVTENAELRLQLAEAQDQCVELAVDAGELHGACRTPEPAGVYGSLSHTQTELAASTLGAGHDPSRHRCQAEATL